MGRARGREALERPSSRSFKVGNLYVNVHSADHKAGRDSRYSSSRELDSGRRRDRAAFRSVRMPARICARFRCDATLSCDGFSCFISYRNRVQIAGLVSRAGSA